MKLVNESCFYIPRSGFTVFKDLFPFFHININSPITASCTANWNISERNIPSGKNKCIYFVIFNLNNFSFACRSFYCAFHSPLMESAKEKLKEALDEVKFHKPSIPVYFNVTAKPDIAPEYIFNRIIS